MRNCIAFLLSLFSSLPLIGQEQWEQEGEIEDAEIVVEKERIIKLPEERRNFEKIQPSPIDEALTDMNFEFNEYEYSFSPYAPRLRAARLKQESVEKLYGNYLKLGYGNFKTPFVQGYLSNKRNSEYGAGLRVKHLSSGEGPIDDENSATSDSEIEIFGKRFTSDIVLSGSAQYNREKYHFYGYDRDLEVEDDTIEQIYNQISLNLGIEDNYASDDINYNLKTGLNYLSDDFNAEEIMFTADGKIDFAIAGDYRFFVQTDLILSKREDSASIDRNLFQINPYLRIPLDAVQLDVGFRLAVENDTVVNADETHFYPYVKADYRLGDQVSLYAGIDGNIQPRTLQSSFSENPFIGPNVSVFHTNQKLNFFGGLEGKILQQVNFNAGLSVGILENLYYYANAAEDSTRFDILLDGGETTLTNIFGEISFQHTDFLSHLRLDYFNYDSEIFSEVFHRPDFKLSWVNNYNIYEKILLNAEIYVMSGIHAFNLQSGRTTALDSFADINFKVDYLLSERASVFISLKNILDNEYETLWNYPVKGAQFLGGMTFSF